MIKAIIFDNVGVFTKKGLGKALDIISAKYNIDRQELETVYKPLLSRASAGETTAINVWEQVIKHFNITADPKEMLDVIIDCYGSEKNEEMFEYAKELSKRFDIAMLTNFSDSFDELNKKLGLESVFSPDKIFVSSKIKLRKPDREAFEYVLNKLGYKAEESLLSIFPETLPLNHSH